MIEEGRRSLKKVDARLRAGCSSRDETFFSSDYLCQVAWPSRQPRSIYPFLPSFLFFFFFSFTLSPILLRILSAPFPNDRPFVFLGLEISRKSSSSLLFRVSSLFPFCSILFRLLALFHFIRLIVSFVRSLLCLFARNLRGVLL